MSGDDEHLVPVISPALNTCSGSHHAPDTKAYVVEPISIHPHCIGRAPEAGPQGKEYLLDGSAYCMDSRGQPQAIAQPMAVRRLTPVECERLQGFPDNYTNIPWRKKDESPDGPRYKALGNSWAVPNVRWIGQRIQENLK
jgi:DNA (cytosine-5)-methyltransferase 1